MTQKKTMTLDEFAAYIQEELPKLMAEKYDPKQYKFSKRNIVLFLSFAIMPYC